MTDRITKEQRSRNMSAVKAKGNKTTEIKVVKYFKNKGITGWRRHNKKIFGNPDFVFLKDKVVIFIDGCFWHGCPYHYHVPKTNKKFWNAKIKANKKRGKIVNSVLRKNNWTVVRVWEHQLKKDQPFYLEKIRKLLLK
ncbi:MAG: very short patch repair endonuclease [Patescibacteria group bacterium]